MPFVKGDPRINRAGRKKGSRGKKNIPSLKEIQDEIQKNSIAGVRKLVAQMEDDNVSEEIKRKNAQWFVETSLSIEELKAIAKAEKRKLKSTNSDIAPEEQEQEDEVEVSLTAVS